MLLKKFLDLPLLIHDNIKNISLIDILRLYFKKESVDFNYKCIKCNKILKISKVIKLVKFP